MRIVLTGVSLMCAAIVAAPVALAGSSVPPRDAFNARVSRATGRLTRDRGSFAVDLTPGQAQGASRAVTLSFHGPRCGHKRRCFSPNATLTGTLTAKPSGVADLGQQFTLTASGQFKTLGHVTADGLVHGTGFIARGYETMTLTLSSSSGTVTLNAQSGQVPGFTSP